MDKDNKTENSYHVELPDEHKDPLIQFLHVTIRLAVKVLAILMALVIIWGVGDVIYVLYQRLMTPPMYLLNISDIFATFGAFLAVLIAIEIFINITIYIRDDVLPVKLVIATALMAISRKVIVFDFKELTPMYIFASATVVLALGVTYWLVNKE
ncbi:MAG: phosphate-starvation-inducible PsiE family protein [Methylococcaceae bacterium]